jgi:hypothetical protein
VADVCVSGSALALFGGIGGILGTVIVWLATRYIDSLLRRGDEWRAIAERSSGLASGLTEVAKARRS